MSPKRLERQPKDPVDQAEETSSLSYCGQKRRYAGRDIKIGIKTRRSSEFELGNAMSINSNLENIQVNLNSIFNFYTIRVTGKIIKKQKVEFIKKFYRFLILLDFL
ncbi:MAG: hypothetical protein Tsb0021_03140 [Chlamydiales bacterium]